MTSVPNVISRRQSWIRAAAVATLFMSPSPLVCSVLTERVLEHATVDYLRSRFERGELTLSSREVALTASAHDAAREVWFAAHDVNFGIGFAGVAAFGSSGVLATIAILLLLLTRPPKDDACVRANRAEEA